LNGHAINEINDAISDAKSKSGVIEHKGNHILIIFSPLITKTVGDNEVLAVKCAWKIKQRLDTYNKRFTGKIDYNMGVNAGQVVAALVGGKLNYTSLGNGVLLARRISDMGSGKVLVGQTVRSKLMRELKVNKISHSIGNVDIYDVYNITNIESNQEKLKALLKRQSFS
jgi:class 3 adenylate cyclase